VHIRLLLAGLVKKLTELLLDSERHICFLLPGIGGGSVRAIEAVSSQFVG